MSGRVGGCNAGGRRARVESLRRGFTILELLLVLALASLTATAAIPAYFSRSEVTLDNATRLLVDDLRQAQIRAVYRNAPVEVCFEVDGDGYSILDRAGGDDEYPAQSSEVFRRYSQDAVFEGVRFSAIQLEPGRSLLFAADGTTLTGGRLTLDYGGDARTVSIDPARGTIRAPELEACALRDHR